MWSLVSFAAVFRKGCEGDYVKSRNDYIHDKFQFSENLEKRSVKVSPKFDIVGYKKTK